jgi:hypothetical protein
MAIEKTTDRPTIDSLETALQTLADTAAVNDALAAQSQRVEALFHQLSRARTENAWLRGLALDYLRESFRGPVGLDVQRYLGRVQRHTLELEEAVAQATGTVA